MALSVRRTDPTCALASFQAGAPQLVDLRPGGALRALPALGPGAPLAATLRIATLKTLLASFQASAPQLVDLRPGGALRALPALGPGASSLETLKPSPTPKPLRVALKQAGPRKRVNTAPATTCTCGAFRAWGQAAWGDMHARVRAQTTAAGRRAARRCSAAAAPTSSWRPWARSRCWTPTRKLSCNQSRQGHLGP